MSEIQGIQAERLYLVTSGEWSSFGHVGALRGPADADWPELLRLFQRAALAARMRHLRSSSRQAEPYANPGSFHQWLAARPEFHEEVPVEVHCGWRGTRGSGARGGQEMTVEVHDE